MQKCVMCNDTIVFETRNLTLTTGASVTQKMTTDTWFVTLIFLSIPSCSSKFRIWSSNWDRPPARSVRAFCSAASWDS